MRSQQMATRRNTSTTTSTVTKMFSLQTKLLLLLLLQQQPNQVHSFSMILPRRGTPTGGTTSITTLQSSIRNNIPSSTNTNTNSPLSSSPTTKRKHQTEIPNIRSFHCGAGCFWAPQDSLQRTPGILSTSVGYCGDDTYKSIPNYEVVCSGRTQLVEAVRIIYDANQLSYSELLDLYTNVFNTAERGNKRQYEGVIFTMTEEEERLAKAKTEVGDGNCDFCKVEPMSRIFYEAEGYHQNYWSKFRVRVGVFGLVLALISVLGSGNFGGVEIGQTVWNGVCYGAIGFVLLERRLDAKVKEISVY